MKIRQGFVSNSSSSSFILAITRNFTLPEELEEAFLGEYYNYYDGEEDDIVVKDAVALALDNMCSQKTIWQEQCPTSVHALVNTITDNEELSKKHYIECIDAGPDEGQYINVLCDGEKEEFFEKMKYILESNGET